MPTPVSTVTPGPFASQHIDPEDQRAFIERSQRRARELAAHALEENYAKRVAELALMRSEYQRGFDAGGQGQYQQGYTSGWVWGAVCGAVTSMMASAVAIIGFSEQIAAALGH